MSSQLDLFASRPRNFDEKALIRRLQDAAHGKPVAGRGLSASAVKRLMTPLPRVTAFD